MESSKKYVAYYRVSTKRQGRSRLGLEAQKETIKNCTQDGRLVAEFVEMESERCCLFGKGLCLDFTYYLQDNTRGF